MDNYLVFFDENSRIVVKPFYDFLEAAIEESAEPARSKLQALFTSFDFFGDKPDTAAVQAHEAEILEAFKNMEDIPFEHDVIASFHYAENPETAIAEAFEFWEKEEGLGPDGTNDSNPGPAPSAV